MLEETRIWSKENPDKKAEHKSRWIKNHREQYLAIRRRSHQLHKEEENIERPLYDLKRKLNIWIQEIGYPVIFSLANEDCDACGMPTKKNFLYKFNGRTLCVVCLKDLKDTSPIHPRKRFVFEKKACKKCGRMAIDVKKGLCIDCRVRAKRLAYEKTWALFTDGDMARLEEANSTEDLASDEPQI